MAFPPRDYPVIHRSCSPFYFSLIFLFLSGFISAEKTEEQKTQTLTYELGEITVYAPPGESYIFSPFFKEIIEAPQQSPVRSLTDQLSILPGVRTTRYGGWGGFTTLSIRGSSPSQVLFFWNGIPLNLGYTGIVNLSDLPLEGIKRIEVYRSFTPLEMGSGAIGGAVNLISQEYPYSPRFSSFTASYSTGKFSLFLPYLNHWVAFAGESSRGNFPFDSDNGTPYNSADDFTDVRRNNDYRALEGMGRFQWRKKSTLWVVDAEAYSKKQGLPGIYSNQAKHARFNPRRWLLSLSAQQTWREARGDFLFYFHRQNDHFIDPEGEISLLPQDSIYETVAWGTRAQISFPFSSSHLLATSLNYRNESFRAKGSNPIQRDGKNQRQSLFMGLADTYWVTDQWGVYLQTGWESIESRFEETRREHLISAHAGMTYLLDSQIAIKGNIGKAYRVPNFTELFGDRGFVAGNPDLVPEKSLNMDIGGNFSGRWGNFTFAYFESHPKNLILYWQNSQRTIKAFNLDQAEIKGWEFSLKSRWKGYDILTNYTYQRAVDRGTSFWKGNFLPSRPVHDAFFRLQHKLSRKFSITTYYELAYTGKIYLDRANQILRSGIRTHTVGLSRQRGSLLYTLEVRNIWNVKGSDTLGFPLPGRAWFFSVSTPILEKGNG